MNYKLLEALQVVAKGEDPFVGVETADDWESDELEEVLRFMKSNGLTPKGTGKPTRPSKATPHDVAYDPDLDLYYLLVYNRGSGGDCWIIEDSGKAIFVSSFQGQFKAQPGVKIYKGGRWHDYMSADAIRAILDIVDPTWDKDPLEENEALSTNSEKITKKYIIPSESRSGDAKAWE